MAPNPSKTRLPRQTAIVLALVGVLSSCSVTPVAVTDQEVRDRVAADQELIYQAQEPITHPLCFYDALARAFKYNLDYRLKLMEHALARGLSDVSGFDLLPRLTASAGYQVRSNDSGSTSRDLNGPTAGQVSAAASTSEQRQHTLSAVELSWNVLDFGVSYYRAKQAAEEVNIAAERRRKVLQNIVQDVRSAYWRAVGAQKLARQSDELAQRVQRAIEQSRHAEASGTLPPAEALTYQRALYDALSMINQRRQELDFAKRELAALMNVPPGMPFELEESIEPPLPPTPINVSQLELVALEHRSELKEEDYRARSDAHETRKQLLSLLPNLDLSVGLRSDSNQYLYNRDWYDASARISWNLMRLASKDALEKTEESRRKTTEMRRLSLSMAVITQVRVSIERYRLATQDLALSDEASRIDQRLALINRASVLSRATGELEAIRTEARALVSQFQRAAAYATAQSAYGRIYNSLGLDVMPEKIDSAQVADVARAVRAVLQENENDAFLFTVADLPKPHSLRLELTGLPGDVSLERIHQAVLRKLQLSRVDIASGPETWRWVMNLKRGTVSNGLERPTWEMSLYRPDGSLVQARNYTSVLSASPDERSLQAFAEAAALSQVSGLKGHLTPQFNP